MTAKEWRESNPKKSGNIRDYADTLNLIVLSNLEVLHSEFVAQGLNQRERMEKLNSIAKKQIETLKNNINIEKIQNLSNNKLLDGELERDAVVSKIEITASDNKKYNTDIYNLDV